MHLKSPISEEVCEKILSSLGSDRQTLAAVIEADCLASRQALRLYWQNDSASKELLEELDDEPESRQQFLADMVRNIVTELKVPGAHHEGRGSQFLQLQSLVVEHGKAFHRRETRTYARVKRFVGCRMRELQIGSEDFDCYDLSPMCDNFMPNLSASVDLHSLILHSRVKGATAGDLLQVLQSCVRLSTLRLGKDTEPLLDEAAFQTMAGHLEIQELYIKKHLDKSLVLSIATTPQPFRNISNLILHADAAAINILLPRMEKVDRVELTIHGMSSIFPSLRHLENLRSL
jgi:hypothetical protein